MRVVEVHEWTQKHLSNPTPTPKIAHWGPKKSKMTPKLGQNQILEMIETYKI